MRNSFPILSTLVGAVVGAGDGYLAGVDSAAAGCTTGATTAPGCAPESFIKRKATWLQAAALLGGGLMTVSGVGSIDIADGLTISGATLLARQGGVEVYNMGKSKPVYAGARVQAFPAVAGRAAAVGAPQWSYPDQRQPIGPWG